MDPLFEVHKLNESGLSKAWVIAHAFNDLLDRLEALGIAGSREFAICRTKLEEACFFAKKSLAGDPSNQEPKMSSAQGAAMGAKT